MKERGIPFSGDMVRAILDGRKTMTRRIFKAPEPLSNGYEWCFHETKDGLWELGAIHPTGDGSLHSYIKCPYGVPGDRLYCRETWGRCDFPASTASFGRIKILYRADGETKYDIGKWRPSIHMPKAAARIWMEITDVKVERVQEIGWPDVVAEGIKDPRRAKLRVDPKRGLVVMFRNLWDSLNAKRGFGWDVNPWVWVISFKRLEKEI